MSRGARRRGYASMSHPETKTMTAEETAAFEAMITSALARTLQPLVDTMADGFTKLDTRIAGIETRLDRLEARVTQLARIVTIMQLDVEDVRVQLEQLRREFRRDRSEAEQLADFERRIAALEALLKAPQ